MLRARLARIAVATAGALALSSGALARDWALDPPRIDTADTKAQRDWANRYLDQEDWMLAGFANGQFWLVSSEVSAHNDYPKVQDWVRIENGRPYPPGLHVGSSLEQVEVDCARSTYKTLRIIDYRSNNLRGEILADTDISKPKTEATPAGSIGEAAVKQICSDAAPPEGAK